MTSARIKSSILSTIIILGLILTNFLIQVGVNPSYKNMSTDSGIFAYCGQVILEGGLMYRDCWDNKPPAVYYLNAAAIWLAGANPFAIWLFQAVWLTTAGVAFFLILARIWESKGLAALASFTLLLVQLYPDIFQGGNFTETYAILPIVFSIFAFWEYLNTGHRRWLLVLGLLTAVGFLFKPTYISIGLSCAILLVYLGVRSRSVKITGLDLITLGLSALFPLVLVGLYWVWQRDFNELWFAVFAHNITYLQAGLSLHSLYGTARLFLIQQPMAALTILVGSSLSAFLFQHGRQIFSRQPPTISGLTLNLSPGRMDPPTVHAWFMSGIFLSIFFDIAFLASSGKNFGHYLQVVIPGMAIGLLYLLDVLRQAFQQQLPNRSLWVLSISAMFLVSLSAGLEIAAKEIPAVQELKAFFSIPDPAVYQATELEQYILDHSSPSDSVLVWAGHPSMNFVTHRRSPTRFIFLQHLFTPIPGAPNGFAEFLQELQADPPQLIVVQPISSAGLPYFANPIDSLCPGCDSLATEGMMALQQFIRTRYELSYSIWDWVVFQRIR
jgi:hypothetical protein